MLLPGLNLSLLLGGSLLTSLGGFTSLDLGGSRLDDSHGDGLPHVTDGEATERGEARKGFHAHWLGGLQANDTGVTGLDELRGGLSSFTGTTIHLLQDLGELAGDVSGVAIEHWGVS